MRFGPTLCPSLRQGLNPVPPRRPAVLEVHELIHGHVREGDADRHLLLLRLAHRRAPGQRQVAPRVRAVRRPIVLGRLLEGPRLLVPLGSVGSEAFEALLAALLVEAGEGYGLAAGVDAIHERLLGSQLWLAAGQEERLDARPRTWSSNLADLGVVGHPVGAVIAALVEPRAVVVEAHAVAFAIVHDVNMI